APRVGAEQLLRRRPVLAELVVGDLEPVVPRLAGTWPLVVRRQRTGAGLARVGTRLGEAAVEALQRGREPGQHAACVVRGRAQGGVGCGGPEGSGWAPAQRRSCSKLWAQTLSMAVRNRGRGSPAPWAR